MVRGCVYWAGLCRGHCCYRNSLGCGWVRQDGSAFNSQGTETLQSPPPPGFPCLASCSVSGKVVTGRGGRRIPCWGLLARNRRNAKNRNGNVRRKPSHFRSPSRSQPPLSNHSCHLCHSRHRCPSHHSRLRQSSQTPKNVLLNAPPVHPPRIPRGQVPTRTHTKER